MLHFHAFYTNAKFHMLDAAAPPGPTGMGMSPAHRWSVPSEAGWLKALPPLSPPSAVEQEGRHAGAESMQQHVHRWSHRMLAVLLLMHGNPISFIAGALLLQL